MPTDDRPLILIVDDSVDHLEFLRSALGARYRVETASSGLDGYTAACAALPDAILLDLVMPVIDGHTVVRKLRANPATARIPIIFVTGLDAAGVEARGGPLEVTVLQKPCHQGEILAAIKGALATSSR